MSSNSTALSDPPELPRPARRSFRSKRAKPGSPLTAHGEPLLWLTGGALVLAITMIVTLMAFIFYQGLATFWPQPLIQLETVEGQNYMGELSRTERFKPGENFYAEVSETAKQRADEELSANEGELRRRLFRTGNYDVSGSHFEWINDCQVKHETTPEWALVVERLTWGRFYGFPVAFLEDDQVTAESPEDAWKKFNEFHDAVHSRWREKVSLQKHDLGALNHYEKSAQLQVRKAELRYGSNSPEYKAAEKRRAEIEQEAVQKKAKINAKIAELEAENHRLQFKLITAGGEEKVMPMEEIVRAYPANQLHFFGKLGVYLSRWGEFLWDDPREANSEGGVFPAIFGTVVMTIVMSFFVAPFGVLAALYLREYAKPGPIVSAVRIAINNLAGVPSVVFGAFGMGFFCYGLGGWIDQQFFAASLPESTFGTAGIMWASLTLALLTLPVVIVTTEEAIAAVPGSMREGSYACGASKWQTIKRIILPRALPGIMTGMILAMARGAGEVAPLMLVGAVKLAADLPVDSLFPFVHPERKFMHLGFHIFDLGFQSSNSEAAKPMVFTTTLLLIMIIAVLNILAVWLRSRLRRRFVASHF